MAERRMFAKTIVLSDAFLDMPLSARCLYFTLGMMADDDGFVGSPKAIMRQCGASQDDIAILLQKRFVLGFESGVIVIKHWRMNNYLQNDRKKNTSYIEELAMLEIDKKGAYTERKSEMYTKCIQDVYTGKDSIDKNSIDKSNTLYSDTKRERFVPPSHDEVREYCTTAGYHFDIDEYIDFYTSKGWMVGNQSMKDWKASVRNWARNHNDKPKPNNLGAFGNYKQTSTDDEWNELTDMSLKEVNGL